MSGELEKQRRVAFRLFSGVSLFFLALAAALTWGTPAQEASSSTPAPEARQPAVENKTPLPKRHSAPEHNEQAATAGWVIDGAGEPMVGVAIHRVNAEGEAGEQVALTEADGAYRFAQTPAPGDELILLGPSVFPSTFRYSAQEKGARIMATRQMQISARVMHANKPVAGATVAMKDGSGPRARTQVSDEEGLVLFEGLVPGVYELSAHGRMLASLVVQASRLSEDKAVVELPMQSASRGVGQVLDGQGKGLMASVTLISLQGPHASYHVESDAEGRFAIDGLLPGRWQVRAEAPGYVSTQDYVLEAATEEVELAIRLRKGGVAQGQVVDSRGNPVANARVVLRGKSSTRANPRQSVGTRWVHPLASERAMPIRASRRFGAARDGLRPAECGHGHCGVDIGTERGRVVHAAADARVARVIRDGQGKAGRYVVLEHQGGLNTFYMHLDEIQDELAPGQWLRAGQPIGTIGRTGVIRSGAHLHFAISQEEGERSWFIDPEPILRHALVLPVPAELQLATAQESSTQVAEVLAPGAMPAGNQSLVTDSAGRFRVEGLVAGSYNASAFHDELAPGTSGKFEIRYGQESPELLVRLQDGVEVYGVVQGPEGPIAGARIVAEEGAGLSARSVAKSFADAEGRFRLRRLSGALTLRVSAPGYGLHEREVKLLGKSSASSRRELFVLAAQNRQLRGQVRDASGFPVRNASVRIVSGPSGRGRRVTTDEYGHYLFENLASGRYGVDVLSSRHPTASHKISTEGSHELRLEQGGVIRLRLSDLHSRRSLIGLRVEAFGPKGRRTSLVTDASGDALFSALCVGSWKFRVRSKGFVHQERELVVRASDDSHATPTLEVMELSRGASLAGVLRDADGERVPGAKVWVGEASTTSDQDGRFRLEDVGTGEVLLQANRNEEEGELDLTLSPGDELVTLELRFD